VTTAAVASAGIPVAGLESRSLSLKGKAEPTDVLVLNVSESAPVPRV